jgi:N-acetylmuramoyl-L-alanine amidase
LAGTAAVRIVVFTLLFASLQAQAPPAAPFTIVTSDGRRTLPATLLNGQDLVALDDIASVFGAALKEDALAGGFILTHRGRTIVASANGTTVSVNGRVVALPSAVVRAGRRWLVPVEFLQSALGAIHDQRILVRRPSRLVLVGDVRVPRVTARIDSPGPPTRAMVEVTPAAPVTTATETDRLTVRIEADALDLALPAGGGLIAQFRAGEQPNTLVVSLDPDAGSVRVVPQITDTASRVTIEVSSAGAPAATPAPGPAPTTAAPPPVDPEALLARRPAFRTIVLDPGHGGEDPGVRGASGVREKQVALDVAQRLRTMLEAKLGVRVLLTRDQDVAITADARVATANTNKADVFVSLHANAAPSAALAGAEVYHLELDAAGEEARDDAARASVTLPVLGGGTRTLDLVPWNQAQARHVSDSALLAGMIAEQLGTHKVGMSPTPVRSAPLRLLEGLNMPAVMLEMAYLTNPGQEKLIASDAHRNLIAQALFEAIAKFRVHVEETRTQ